jgi:hypothetical protein
MGATCNINCQKNDHAGVKSITLTCKTIVQALSMYGSESCVLKDAMERTLQSFHQKCARYTTGNCIRPEPSDPEGEKWICPPSEGVLEEQYYVNQRRNSIEKYITMRPI